MGLTWDEFVAVHAPAVLQAATRILRNPADAEEVAQDVFIEIFRAGRFEELHAQPGLIRTIATRRSLDRLRRRKSVHKLNGGEVSPQTFEPGEYAIAGERHYPATSDRSPSSPIGGVACHGSSTVREDRLPVTSSM